MKKKKIKSKKWIFLGIFFILLIVGSILIFFVIPFPYKVMEYYTVQEQRTTTEEYTEWVNSKNCDYDRDCICKHVSWLGLGSCDSCKCYRERLVNVWVPVTKERKSTRKAILYNILTDNVKREFNV